MASSIQNDLTAWRVFVTTARTGSISLTAVELDMPTARVSKLIGALESGLGYPLFDRRRRPLAPTPRGAALLAAAAPLVAGFDDAWAVFRETESQQIIRFAAPIDLARLYFADVLLRYSEEHPQVSFQIQPEVTADAVREGRTDVAILNHIPADTTDLVVRHYRTDSTTALATPAYLRAHGCPASPEDFRHHTGLLLETVGHTPTTRLFRDGVSSGLLNWQQFFITHDQMNLKTLLLENRGITVDLFIGHVIPELRAGAVVPILKGWEREPWRMCVVTHYNTERRFKAIRDFAVYIMAKTNADFEVDNTDARRTVADIWGD